MNIKPATDNIEEYLREDGTVDFESDSITHLADALYQKSNSDIEYIQAAYEFVRDKISHSADIDEDAVTCSASEVLKAGHGICFAKSHLLAALLRCKSIPTGFCYQKLFIDDQAEPGLVYHGLNGVYVDKYKKWIRLDARGNKKGINAQFSLEEEQLAYNIRPEKGEEDGLVVYPAPDVMILEKLRAYKTRKELWKNLPTEQGYNL